MAKSGSIHNDYSEIEVVFCNGTTCKMRSTMKAKQYQLDIDTETHPVWNDKVGNPILKKGGIEDFNNRYQGMSFLDFGSEPKSE